jgi:hypothetical protein
MLKVNVQAQPPCNPSPITLTAVKDTLCFDSTTTVCAPAGYASYTWGTGNTTACITAPAGFTEVTVTDNNGCTVRATITIALDRLTLEVLTRENCNPELATISMSTSPTDPGVGNLIYTISNGDTGSVITGVPPGTYTCTVTDANRCTASALAIINNPADSVDPVQPLCIVATDTALMHNIIIWENIDTIFTSYFCIYRANTQDTNYRLIGSVSAWGLGSYEDSSSLANQFSYRYKINSANYCGKHNQLSPYHQTIFLWSPAPGQYSWTPYVIENDATPIGSYNLYRDTAGSGNWELLQALADTQTTAFDPEYAMYPNARYMIVVQLAVSCNPTRGITNITSNILSNANKPNGIDDLKQGGLRVFPNPMHDHVVFMMDDMKSISITDVLGNSIYKNNGRQGTLNISLSQWTSGIYFYTVHTECCSYTGKLIKD